MSARSIALAAFFATISSLVTAPPAKAICEPYLELRTMNTYDTGARLLNGQWIVGSSVLIYSHHCTGNIYAMDWTAAHLIVDTLGLSPYPIASTSRSFYDYQFDDTISGTAGYSTCYRGTATASVTYLGSTVGGDYGGNSVCTDPAPSGGGGGGGGGCVPTETNPCTGGGGSGPGGGWNNQDCGYNNVEFGGCASPIVIDVEDGSYPMSGPVNPVQFDLNADGTLDVSTWTAPGSSVGFLALDRNHNGKVDDGTELFGNHTPSGSGHVAANGFVALAVCDGNHDGVINAADAIWASLLLWIDANHNGRSEPEELRSLSTTAVRAISLDYRTHMRRDAFGNLFQYEGTVQLSSGVRHIYDVFFRIRE